MKKGVAEKSQRSVKQVNEKKGATKGNSKFLICICENSCSLLMRTLQFLAEVVCKAVPLFHVDRQETR